MQMLGRKTRDVLDTNILKPAFCAGKKNFNFSIRKRHWEMFV